MVPAKYFSIFFLLAWLTWITKFGSADEFYIVPEYEENSDSESGADEESLTWSTIIDSTATNNHSWNLREATVGTLKQFVRFTEPNPPTLKAPFFVDSVGSFLGIVLRFEIFTKATGRNFILPPPKGGNATARLYSMSYAINHSWLRLEYCRKIDRSLNEIIRGLVSQRLQSKKPLTQENVESLLHIVLEKMAFAMKRIVPEEILKVDTKAGLALRPDPGVYIPFDSLTEDDIDEDQVRAWLRNKNTIQFLIHQQVVNTIKRLTNVETSTKEDIILSLVADISAKWCKVNRNIQTIYVAALMRATRDFIISEFPHGTIRSLAMDLDASIDADPHMKQTWNTMKRTRLSRFRHVLPFFATFK